MSSDGNDDTVSGPPPLGRQLRRLLVLVGPPAATVGALLGVAVVAPAVGFGLLLLAVSVTGTVAAILGQGRGPTIESVEAAHEIGMGADTGNVASEVPARSFLTTYLYGVSGFGIVAAVLVAVFLL
jgi:hypothetical protein